MSTNTDTHTGTQSKYSNPRCACAPRVNDQSCELTITNMTVNDKNGEFDYWQTQQLMITMVN